MLLPIIYSYVIGLQERQVVLCSHEASMYVCLRLHLIFSVVGCACKKGLLANIIEAYKLK